MKRLKSELGMTIIEIVLVMTISAIAFTGMVVAYSEGVKYTRQNTNMMTLYNEGSSALKLMSAAIRNAGRIRISSYGGARDAEIELAYPTLRGGGTIDFYFIKQSKELKWNNRFHGNNKLHMTLLPMLDFNASPFEEPYLKVKDLKFISLDHMGIPAPYLRGFSLIKIEMVLEDAFGDTLYLSTVNSKRNEY